MTHSGSHHSGSRHSGSHRSDSHHSGSHHSASHHSGSHHSGSHHSGSRHSSHHSGSRRSHHSTADLGGMDTIYQLEGDNYYGGGSRASTIRPSSSRTVVPYTGTRRDDAERSDITDRLYDLSRYPSLRNEGERYDFDNDPPAPARESGRGYSSRTSGGGRYGSSSSRYGSSSSRNWSSGATYGDDDYGGYDTAVGAMSSYSRQPGEPNVVFRSAEGVERPFYGEYRYEIAGEDYPEGAWLFDSRSMKNRGY